ncbi:MAG TPA: TIGR03619 family F420-dependent LLM class oxidoreductase, partial [Pseudonocardia sp.]|uniref:TIGR03619 family F420-dependent LLM class oxidoreductase n=1 Tax=Pseudonocardia sp. TaxID=60912 RepID=UPI002F429789
TRRLLLGTAVLLLVQRDVIHTAKQVASLDVLSGGRVVLAVGAGWNEAEMRNHGTNPATRGRLMEEQLAALKVIWASDGAEFHGEHVDFGPIHLWPKPVRRPHPPIFIGGHSAAARARVLAHGDGWFPLQVTPADIAELRRSATERGRTGLTVNVPAAPDTLDTLEGFAQAGADRATFHLETVPESETLRKLDELSALTGRYGR